MWCSINRKSWHGALSVPMLWPVVSDDFALVSARTEIPTTENQDYAAQLKRSRSRKREAVHQLGGKCVLCGYARNYAALHFHHISGQKDFGLDLRALSNRSWQSILEEVEKCILLCANCHAETHHPNATSRLETDQTEITTSYNQ